jgi:hypothetical protein
MDSREYIEVVNQFYDLVADKFANIIKTYALSMQSEKRLYIRLEGPEISVLVGYDATRLQGVGVSIVVRDRATLSVKTEVVGGYRHQIVRYGVGGKNIPVETGYGLSELLRAIGRYELPEAWKDPVADRTSLGDVLTRMAELLAKYGDKALRCDRDFLALLEARERVERERYNQDRRLWEASNAALEAWGSGRYVDVVSLLGPFKDNKRYRKRVTWGRRNNLHELILQILMGIGLEAFSGSSSLTQEELNILQEAVNRIKETPH